MTPIAEVIWGSDDPNRLFGASACTPAPWPSAPRSKLSPSVDREAVRALLRAPVDLRDVDPRTLYASQPWVLREHVTYYRSGRWERTGRTSADHRVELNQYPVVVDDHRGRPLIIAGHHRAAAAVLAGRPLRVRVAAARTPCVVTPLLFLDAKARAVDVAEALATISSGRTARVETIEQAADVLEALGVDEATVAWRSNNVRRALCGKPSNG